PASAPATLTAAVPAPATPPAVAASMPADAASAAAERQRVQQLEEGLAALQKKSRATEAALATLQARVNDAESARYTSPLVLVLAALCALLALLAGLLWWRQRRLGAAGQWWTGPPSEPAPSSAALLDPTPMAPPLVVPPLPAEPALPIAIADPFTPSTFVEEDEPRASDAGPTAHALTVEELIDLEQQAEFFIVLGQDEAAIDLLMSHVRGDAGSSPLPYLQLLDIHRRRGDEAAYRRIRDRFSQRFNANSPAWSADPLAGRTLVAYPETIVDLQQHWFAPGRVMQMLESALFRRDLSDPTFDLPAYRELLFLYTIAHDLAEHGDAAPTNVDLLLPLPAPGDPPETTQPLAAAPALERLSLDVDVTAPPAPAPAPPDIHLIDLELDPPAPPKPGSGR
ncbi:MAG TPA: hypothetical protein VNU71_10565, partial [Burkholderiaceae bacterium]|nr:hypothetical protein [Burkholderiaceae bacterium]